MSACPPGDRELDTSLSAAAVLGVNVAMMLAGGSPALTHQRAMAARVAADRA